MTATLVVPPIMTVPFAYQGAKSPVPVDSQIGITDGEASYYDGFPPLTMVDFASGGIPPDGKQFNQLFNTITEMLIFANQGGMYRFNASLSGAIGGYPVGVVLQSDDYRSSYVNILANNTTNFNTTPASIGVSWIPFAGDAVGDVTGPASAVNNQIALFNGTTGKLLKGGAIVGTAAGADVQTSATDATAGRVLTVGAFGVGSSNAPLVSNPNTVAVNGLYRVSGSANTPTTGSYYTLIHEQFDASAIQHLTEVSITARQFVRVSLSGTWQPWIELLQGDSGEQVPTFVNGFSDQDRFRYRKVGKTVYITGSLGHNAAWPYLTTIFTLPVGYRPAGPVSQVIMAASSNLAYHQTTITANSDGTVAIGTVYTLNGTPTGMCTATVSLSFPVA